MSIIIEYTVVNNKNEAFSKAKEVITADYISQWNVDVELEYDHEAYFICAKGKGFNLRLDFYEDNCMVEINLAFFLRPFKGKIESILNQELKSNL